MTDIGPIVSASISPPPLCAICNERSPIYTCPRCTIRTCSLPCSAGHKSRTGCSGVRNKAAYVPMNKYGWGTMMDDYVYLEEVGRKAVESGREIALGGYNVSANNGSRGRGMRGRGRGRGRGGAKGFGRTKRDVLKMQLDFRDIDMELLPDGMEKRKLNQSVWDFKNRTALLTIEFKFHPPPDPLAPFSESSIPLVTLLAHKNNINSTLLELLQKQVTERFKGKKDKNPSGWVKSLVFPDPDDPEGFVKPICVIPTPSAIALATSTPPTRRPKTGYYKLDPTQTLSALLRYKTFVEYPCIEIFEDGAFRGIVIDDNGSIQFDDNERKPKRRKIDVKAGRKAISGLIGGYGSDDESEDEAEKSVLITLGEYGDSDDEADVLRGDEQEEDDGAEEEEGIEDDDDDREGDHNMENIDYEKLVLKVKEVESKLGFLGDDDDLDWGESDDEEQSQRIARTAPQDLSNMQPP